MVVLEVPRLQVHGLPRRVDPRDRVVEERDVAPANRRVRASPLARPPAAVEDPLFREPHAEVRAPLDERHLRLPGRRQGIELRRGGQAREAAAEDYDTLHGRLAGDAAPDKYMAASET